MADQGRWFKLWNTAPSDGKLQALPGAIRWAWAAFGCYTKVHGEHGVVTVERSNKVLAAEMDVTVESLFEVILKLPNMQFDCSKVDNGILTVTWLNWKKYQEDSTVYERVKKWRAKQTVTVQEEKRREEKRSNTVTPYNGFAEWPEEWGKIRELIVGPQALPFLAREKHPEWLSDLDWWITMKTLFSSAPRPLENLVTDAVAYIEGEGYRPRSRAAIRLKLKNCMEYAAQKAERRPARPRETVYPRLV